jgi:hypothetical protein
MQRCIASVIVVGVAYGGGVVLDYAAAEKDIVEEDSTAQPYGNVNPVVVS